MQTREPEVVVPVTPIRKLLCRLPSLGRKRSARRKTSRSVTEGDRLCTTTPAWNELSPTDEPNAPTSATIIGQHTPHCSNAPSRLKRGQIAIQQYDDEHDAIVISTLPCYPFCCHQDLLTMSRPRLLQTGYLFNSCLPFSTRFTDLEVSSDTYIRRRIEELVGIVPDIKAISDSMEQCELDGSVTPPSSPLAMYPSRRSGMFRSLEVLVEEDEMDLSSYRRTVKKRRVNSWKGEPSRVSVDRRISQ